MFALMYIAAGRCFLRCVCLGGMFVCRLNIKAFGTVEQKLHRFRVKPIEIPLKTTTTTTRVCSVNREQSSHKSLGFMQMTFCESLYSIVMLVMRYILNTLSVEAADDIIIMNSF